MIKKVNEIKELINKFTVNYLSANNSSIILPSTVIVSNDTIKLFYHELILEEGNVKLIYGREIYNDYNTMLLQEIESKIDRSDIEKELKINLYYVCSETISNAFNEVVNIKCHQFGTDTYINMFIALSDYIISLHNYYLHEINSLDISKKYLTILEKKYLKDFLRSMLMTEISVYEERDYKKLILSKLNKMKHEHINEIFENHKTITCYKSKYIPEADSYSLMTTCIENFMFTHKEYNEKFELFTFKSVIDKLYVTNIR